MTRVAAAILATVFVAGCATSQDWRYSEITSAIDAFKRKQPSTGEAFPQKVRSIYVDGADTLRVYLTDDSGFKGHGYELKLRKLPSGTWVVVDSRSFGL
jgi:hypothetical protein